MDEIIKSNFRKMNQTLKLNEMNIRENCGMVIIASIIATVSVHELFQRGQKRN